jgi:hypothetical protein
MANVNLIAIVAAGISSMVIGYIWYGPLFGKAWMKLMGKKDMGDKSQMPKIYGIMFVASLVTAFVLSVLGATIDIAILAWIGFQAPLLLNSVLFENKSWNLYFLNAGYQLAALITMSWVISYLG